MLGIISWHVNGYQTYLNLTWWKDNVVMVAGTRGGDLWEFEIDLMICIYVEHTCKTLLTSRTMSIMKTSEVIACLFSLVEVHLSQGRLTLWWSVREIDHPFWLVPCHQIPNGTSISDTFTSKSEITKIIINL